MKLTLIYFSIGGKAEKIRLAFAAAKIPFTNKVVAFGDEWQSLKASMPLGQLPVLQVEDEGAETKIVPQSDAILRYVGRLSESLYPSDRALEIDSLMETISEMERPLEISIQGLKSNLIAEEDWTDEAKLAMRHRILTTVIPKYFGHMESLLEQSKSGWLIGDHLSLADIKWHYWVTNLQAGILDGIPPTLADNYPHILAHIEKVKNSPGIKEWYERFPKRSYTTFEYKP